MLRILFPLLFTAGGPLLSGAGLTAPDVTVGRNLQIAATITLSDPAPEEGLEITVSSTDPSRLKLTLRPDHEGSGSITLKLKGKFRESPDFWIVGSGEPGAVVYTASAPGYESAKATATVTPSAITIVGPFRAPSFRSTPRGHPSRIVLYSMRLDDERVPVEQQLIAGGDLLKVKLSSSDPSVGRLEPAELEFPLGSPNVITDFKPAALGQTVLKVIQPPGFTEPAKDAQVTAIVHQPGLLITTEVVIGEHLQTAGVVGLGEPAPPGGVQVFVKSSDPKKLLLSLSDKEGGSESITVTVPEGQVTAPYWLQALASSGEVKYSATAPGYAPREAFVVFAPSGVVLTQSSHGPPDEAELFRPHDAEPPKGFILTMPKLEDQYLTVWTAHLDPATRRTADINVQPLRPGMKVKVALGNSRPEVGEVPSSVALEGGMDHVTFTFKPKAAGETVISAATPHGFVTPSNSTSLKAIIKE